LIKRESKVLNNVQFLARLIDSNPGITSTAARRALCAWKGKEFKPGQYTWYFTTAEGSRCWGAPGFSAGVDYGYWEKRDGGWHITPKGRTKLV
jgi:hypothetical protein